MNCLLIGWFLFLFLVEWFNYFRFFFFRCNYEFCFLTDHRCITTWVMVSLHAIPDWISGTPTSPEVARLAFCMTHFLVSMQLSACAAWSTRHGEISSLKRQRWIFRMVGWPSCCAHQGSAMKSTTSTTLKSALSTARTASFCRSVLYVDWTSFKTRPLCCSSCTALFLHQMPLVHNLLGCKLCIVQLCMWVCMQVPMCVHGCVLALNMGLPDKTVLYE